jgi:serine/threonine protein kinase
VLLGFIDEQEKASATTTSNALVYDGNSYHIDSFLDHGAFRVIAQVHHEDTPKIAYARKQLPLTKVRVEKVQEEVKLNQQASHRHVVKVIDEYQDSGQEWYCIVMKPLADRNLESFLRECMGIRPNNSTSWNRFGMMRRNLFHWIGCLAVTMKYLHNNIRHRDINPQNILVHSSNILLTDFGTSVIFDGSTILTYTSTRGTEKYQPPEANGNIRYGRRGDIFSLGCVFFDMAEAASRPVLKVPFPQVTGTYASCTSVDEFRDGLSSSGEERLLLMKRLPEEFRFNNLLPALLPIVAQMLDPDPGKRCDAGSLVLRTVEAFTVHGFIGAGCCELVAASPSHALREGNVDLTNNNL